MRGACISSLQSYSGGRRITGKLIADVPNVPGAKGVAVAAEFNRGFVSGNDPDPKPVIYLLDLKTLTITGEADAR